ncbi:glycosyl transferase family 2 [Vibrio sp. UCD-FRSSP16_10]|uniref:glycosyltransferase family 2 protein n=1 Tax=unclassified Vibrio TaxID=2614977 RepID=UPI0008003DC9|nr:MULTISPECIES: glycosyltransferase family A protein [unclassified Vibrio]OBT13672.1 glycosyl transferase family 2 [Vibrio sp. UCD-FRSSP16_30]OBT19226.1 glycosyl transferase family 2 [Vibrio sp. UCD-FRSSP16_10]
MEALVSIITPTYNSEKTLEKTYESILSQNYANWEWLVTDDCSTDDTYSMLKGLSKKDYRILINRNEINSGAAVSRNQSIDRASGKYIAFIDSDDAWEPSKLSTQIKLMEEKCLSFTFTAFEMVDSDKRHISTVDTHLTAELDYKDMLKKKATLGCSTVVLKRELISDIRMPLIRTGQDYAYWLSILRLGGKAYPINEILTKYSVLPNSISRNKFNKAKRQWQIYREIEGLDLPTSISCFLFYAYRAVFRK